MPRQLIDIQIETERKNRKQYDNHGRHAYPQCNADLKHSRLPSAMIRKEHEDSEQPCGSTDPESNKKGALNVEIERVYPFLLLMLLLLLLGRRLAVGEMESGFKMQRWWTTWGKGWTGSRMGIGMNAVVGGDGWTRADCRARSGGRCRGGSGRGRVVAMECFGAAGHGCEDYGSEIRWDEMRCDVMGWDRWMTRRRRTSGFEVYVGLGMGWIASTRSVVWSVARSPGRSDGLFRWCGRRGTLAICLQCKRERRLRNIRRGEVEVKRYSINAWMGAAWT